MHKVLRILFVFLHCIAEDHELPFFYFQLLNLQIFQIILFLDRLKEGLIVIQFFFNRLKLFS